MITKKHENYKELIWMLAKTDFKLRYQNSVLGYVWALLQPLLMFLVLNFVFSSIFNVRGTGIEYYGLQLLVALMMFGFFSEGTNAALNSLIAKQQLITKIYVPRWTIIIASTINSALTYATNLIIITLFFIGYQFMPSLSSIVMFIVFSIAIYILIVSFGLLFAPLQVRFRDIKMIWDVVSRVLFFATPIMYSLTMMPDNVQRLMLVNPIGFIVHFTKESLINNHFATASQYIVFITILLSGFALSIYAYRRTEKNVAENI